MSPFPAEVLEQAASVIDLCRARRLTISTAESCTGGLLSACLTEEAGASEVFERGFVTYSNRSKQDMLGVGPLTLELYGAVSAETALEMALGARSRSRTDLAVAVTGIAGPGGGSAVKPVGLVHIAAASSTIPPLRREFRFGDAGRSEIRLLTLRQALAMVLEILRGAPQRE